MTIGIDISPACRKEKTGIEWYAWHITKELIAQADSDIPYRLYADTAPDPLFRDQDVRILRWPSKYFWPELRLSVEILKSPLDILFVPSRALPLALPKKVVTTIHDIGFVPYPEERKRLSREYLLATSRRAAHRADRIITISQFTKDELVKYFKIPPEKIVVTHLGYDRERYIPRKEPPSGEKLYIVCIGRRERRKNIVTLVKAYERICERMKGHAPQLLLIGPPGHHAAEIDRAIAASPARESIHIKNWVSEEEKIRLLQNALCLVHPSLYEGFGLPVIEAQACGVPVVCSRTTALPEIAGDGAVFVDPLSPDEIAGAVARIIEDTQYRAALIEHGHINTERFSWQTTAHETLLCLKGI